jgi:2-C-methyl-D-erythritol 4-phosphate cytidylyltransferase
MVSAIIVAAGKSNRFSRNNKQWLKGGIPPKAGRGKVSKVLVKIDSRPVIYYSLFALNKHPEVDEIIVVASRENSKEINRIVKRFKINKAKGIVLGGKERKDSVLSGLKALSPESSRVLIHDGARPLIDKNTISSVIKASKASGAAITGVPIKPTVKMAYTIWRIAYGKREKIKGLFVKKTLNRDELWDIQTPQVFKKDLILAAYSKFGNRKVTDDAALVEKLKVKVRIVQGSYSNIKITTPEDLIMAEAVLRKIKGKR